MSLGHCIFLQPPMLPHINILYVALLKTLTKPLLLSPSPLSLPPLSHPLAIPVSAPPSSNSDTILFACTFSLWATRCSALLPLESVAARSLDRERGRREGEGRDGRRRERGGWRYYRVGGERGEWREGKVKYYNKQWCIAAILTAVLVNRNNPSDLQL